MPDKYVLKDELFNIDTVTILSRGLERVYKPFDHLNFIEESMSGFESRELKERITWICSLLYKYLPKDYNEATSLLVESLSKEEQKGQFVYGAYCEYVETYGCNETFVDESLQLLGQLTKWFSSEFAIRQFINTYPDKTYAKMYDLSLSSDVDQRRFASEGLRPKLPWAKGIRFDYKKAALPLNNLYYDKERYVVRSVANHLNDLSKIDPSFVISTLKAWKNEGKQETKEMDYLINHSLRTLIKKGHIETLEFLGFSSKPSIKVSPLRIKKRDLVIGDSLEFEFDIEARKNENLIIDFKVTYPMLKGKFSNKVFKIKKASLKEGESLTISKKHPFKVMTTKKLYSGTYSLQIQVNGNSYQETDFSIKVH